MTWTTKIEVVDLETGEELTKKHVTDGLYVIINKKTKTKIYNENFGKKMVIWIVQKNPQQKLSL